MTLKRKCAQRSWDREVDEVVFIRCDIFVFSTLFGGAAWVLPNVPTAVARHPLRELNRASHSQRAPGGRCRDRRQKQEQFNQPLALFDLEAQAEGQGHRLSRQRRHEPGARISPKRTVHEQAQPPLTPPLQGAAVNPQRLPQALHAFGLQAMGHRRNQYDHQACIHASSHEAHRRWGVSSSTAFAAAAQAETHVPLRATPWLAFIIAAEELAAAMNAAVPASLLDQIAIDFFQ